MQCFQRTRLFFPIIKKKEKNMGLWNRYITHNKIRKRKNDSFWLACWFPITEMEALLKDTRRVLGCFKVPWKVRFDDKLCDERLVGEEVPGGCYIFIPWRIVRGLICWGSGFGWDFCIQVITVFSRFLWLRNSNFILFITFFGSKVGLQSRWKPPMIASVTYFEK